MKYRLLSLLLVATAAQLSSASAALTVFSSYEGSAGSTPNDLGFSSTIWSSTAGGGTNSSATFTAGDITSLPTAYTSSGFTNTGNYLGTNFTPAFQTLTTTINVEIASTTYFSFLYRVTALQGNGTQGGGFGFYSGTTELTQIGLGTNQSIRIYRASDTSSTYTATNSFITGTDTAWIVGKLVTGAGNDTLSVNVYTGAETIGSEPGTWDATRSWTLAANIDTIRFNSPTGNPQEFDEFRMGTTFADVTAVPEPSAFLLSGLGVLGLAFRRFRQVRA